MDGPSLRSFDVSADFVLGFSLAFCFCITVDFSCRLVHSIMKRGRSQSPSPQASSTSPPKRPTTSSRDRAPSSDDLRPAVERGGDSPRVERRGQEERPSLDALPMADLVQEVERRVDDRAGALEAILRGGQEDLGRPRRRTRRGGRGRGKDGGSSATGGTPRAPLESSPRRGRIEKKRPDRQARGTPSPEYRLAPNPEPTPRPEGVHRYLMVGQIGALELKQRVMLDPIAPVNRMSLATAHFSGVAVKHLPRGEQQEVSRTEGGRARVVGTAKASLKLSWRDEEMDWEVCEEEVETCIGGAVMSKMGLSIDRVNKILRLERTTRMGFPDPRTM